MVSKVLLLVAHCSREVYRLKSAGEYQKVLGSKKGES